MSASPPPKVIAAKRIVGVSQIDGGDTLAIEIEEASGETVCVLFPSREAGRLSSQITEASAEADRTKEKLSRP
jgi:hypothetical protein